MYLSGRSFSRLRQRGIALVVVLSMVVVVALILIAFVTAMRLERTASTSYSQSINADEIARGALSLITADLINEMSADAPPSVMIAGQPPSATNKPLFTNVTSSNILPRRVGTNAAMPNLVRVSTTTAAYTNIMVRRQDSSPRRSAPLQSLPTAVTSPARAGRPRTSAAIRPTTILRNG